MRGSRVRAPPGSLILFGPPVSFYFFRFVAPLPLTALLGAADLLGGLRADRLGLFPQRIELIAQYPQPLDARRFESIAHKIRLALITLTRMDLSINEGTLVVTGGPGDTPHNAIVIRKTPRGLSAAGAELMLLHKWFGERGRDWTMTRQEMEQRDGRTYDTYEVVLTDGSERRLYFDVTDWLNRAGVSRC